MDIEARIREIVREELALSQKVPPSPDEQMTSVMASEESGYSKTSVGEWCRQGLITGARQACPGGRWSFTRKAWIEFRAKYKRRNLSRLKAVA